MSAGVRGERWEAPALAAAFVAAGYYTSLASLSPTPPVGFLFLNRAGAGILLALLALGAAVGVVALRGERSLAFSPILAPWLLSLGVSSLAGLDPLSGLQVTAIAILTSLFHVGYLNAGARSDVRRAALSWFLATGAVACAASVVMVFLRWPAPLYVFNTGRAAGPFVTANQCASFALLYAGVALGAALSMRGLPQRLALLGLLTALGALYFTFSFGGWIAFACGAVFLAFALNRRAGAAALIVLALGLLAIVPLAQEHHNGGDTVLRIGSWVAGLRIAELFPLTGTGPMTFWEIYPAVAPTGADIPGQFGALHPHNVALSLLDDLGIAGLAAVVAGWVAFGRALREAVRGAPAANRRFGLAVCAGLVGGAVQGAVDLVGVVQIAFVWIPFSAFALVAARYGPP